MSTGDIGLSAARYGKDKVRVCRVVRNEGWHDVVEYEVCALVEGAIETRYGLLPSLLLYFPLCVIIIIPSGVRDDL